MDTKKRSRILLLILIAIIGIGILGYGFLSRDGRSADTLVVSGSLEITEARLGFKIPGRLIERVVDEGEPVSRGQLLARMDPTDQNLAVDQAEAGLSYALAVLAELEAGSRAEDIRLAEAQVDQARAVLVELERGSRDQEVRDAVAEWDRARAALSGARAQLDLVQAEKERHQALYEDRVISFREYDRVMKQYASAESALEEAEARVRSAGEKLSLRKEGTRQERLLQARAAVVQAEAVYDRVKAGPRPETIEQARAKVRVAEETLRQARQQLAYTEIHAPFDGVILSKAAEPGEYLNVGSPVVTLGDLDDVWMRAYVGETHLGRIKLGQEARVTTDTYPGRDYAGTVRFIAGEAEFTPKTVQTREERVKLVYRIKISLANDHRELKPGMPADAVILMGNPHREDR